MRDDVIYRMHEANVRRVFMLLSQFEFLNTRQIAFEQILSSRMARFRAIWDYEWLRRAVDNRQKELLSACKRQLEAAKEKPVIRPISVVGNGRS